jgi:hypothetical protein
MTPPALRADGAIARIAAPALADGWAAAEPQRAWRAGDPGMGRQPGTEGSVFDRGEFSRPAATGNCVG